MNAPLNWHKWVVLSLLGLALSARTIGCDYSSITEKFGAEAVARCNEKCPFQVRLSKSVIFAKQITFPMVYCLCILETIIH